MALDKAKLDPTGSGSKGAGAMAVYVTTDNKATVKGAGYFNNAANELAAAGVPVMLIKASDATFFAKVSVAAGVVTIAAPETYA